jgi:putative hydrolase of the HAD superfamily
MGVKGLRSLGDVRLVTFDGLGTIFRLRAPSVGAVYARYAGLDASGPAADRLEAAFRAVHEAAAPCDASRASDPDALERDWWRARVEETFARAAIAGAPPVDRFFDDLHEHFATAEAWALHDDARAAIEKLRAARMKLAVVSDFDGRLGRVLDGLGVAALFEAVVAGTRAGAPKPFPGPFLAALRAAGLPAAVCVHVGDHPVKDVQGALSIGASAILVDRDGRHAGRTGLIRVSSLAEVPPLLGIR